MIDLMLFFLFLVLHIISFIVLHVFFYIWLTFFKLSIVVDILSFPYSLFEYRVVYTQFIFQFRVK